MEKVNLAEKFSTFSEHWTPKIVGTVDDYDIKIAKVEGDFVWHQHEEDDEMFLVIDGRLHMDFRDRRETIEAGEFIVVAKGTEHKPHAAAECRVLLFERRGLINTGDAAAGVLTVTEPERI